MQHSHHWNTIHNNTPIKTRFHRFLKKTVQTVEQMQYGYVMNIDVLNDVTYLSETPCIDSCSQLTYRKIPC